MLYWTIASTLVASFFSLIVYLYFQRQGQFEDPEEAKYPLFWEE